MKRILRWSLLACWAGLMIAAQAETGSAPFIRKVALTDFLLLETNNDLALSPSNSLVVCFTGITGPGAVERAVALRRQANGRWLLSHLAAVPPKEPGQYRLNEVELAPEIAQHVMLIFRHLMETKALPASRVVYQPSDGDAAWIWVRTGSTTATGVALDAILHLDRGEETAIFRDLCAGLVGIFVAPPEERNRVLTQMDRLATAYVLAHGLEGR